MTDPKSKIAKANDELSETAKTYILENIIEDLTGFAKEFSSPETEWGNDHEDDAVLYYELEKSVTVERVGFIEIDENSGVSPDGLVGADGGIEVKCPYNSVNHLKRFFYKGWEDLKRKEKDYYWQIQGLMFATRRDWCDFVSYDPRLTGNLRMFVLRIPRNEDDISNLAIRLKSAIEFKDNFMLNIL
jgi:hypothetical protein